MVSKVDGIRNPTHLFIPYNALLAGALTEADVVVHTLDLQVALPEVRMIISVLVRASRTAGAGALNARPNEGAFELNVYSGSANGPFNIVIARGTQRLQYRLSVANDIFNLYCFGYVIEVSGGTYG